MITNKLCNKICRVFLAAILTAFAGAVSADTLRVEIDTSSFGTNGWMDLLFNPSDARSALTTARLYDFVGFDAVGGAESAGGVSGSLATGYTLDNLNSGSELFHSVSFGGKIGFNVDFDGAPGSAINRSLSTLTVAMYGADKTTLLGSGDTLTGALVQLYWLPPTTNTAGTVTTRIFDTVATVGTPLQSSPLPTPISPVPEPSAWLMLGLGLGLVILMRRRKSSYPFAL
ncbi:MAG: NF038129 family PEP-CTERM protein [Duganella sp.]